MSYRLSIVLEGQFDFWLHARPARKADHMIISGLILDVPPLTDVSVLNSHRSTARLSACWQLRRRGKACGDIMLVIAA